MPKMRDPLAGRKKAVIAGIIIVLLVLGALVRQMALRPSVPLGDVRVIAALATIQEDGGRVLDAAAYARLKPGPGPVEAVIFPTALQVSVPGVTDQRLREVYAYGGAPLVAQAFSAKAGVPVDAVVIVDESEVARVLSTLPPVSLTLSTPVEVFRHDRYTAVPAGTQVTVTPVELGDLFAAAGSPDPDEDEQPLVESSVLPRPAAEASPAGSEVASDSPGQDVGLQGRLVAALIRAFGSGGGLPAPMRADVWAAPGLGGRLEGLALGAGWPKVRLERAEGSSSISGGRSYWRPAPAWWRDRFAR